MSITLKRPMFRRGGKVNTGIMSGLVDRTNYQKGAFGNMTEDQIRSNIDMLVGLQDQFAPVAKTRLPIGDIGFALASGAPIVDALGVGYKKFVSEDDKRRALLDKRKQAAVSTVLGQALKTSKDTRTDLEKKLEAAGYLKGSPEYQAAMATLLFKDVRPKAGFRTLTEAEAKEKLGSAYEEGKAYQIDEDPRSSNFNKVFVIGGGGTNITIGDKFTGQKEGVVQQPGARDKIVQATSFVTRQLGNIEDIEKLLAEDPSLAGLSGFARRKANQIITAAKDFNFDLTGTIKELGAGDLVLDTDIAKLNAIEDLIVPAYARVLNPNTRITNLMLNEAKAAINLTGLTGSDEVKARLLEIKNQFKTYIDDQNALLGKQIIDQNIMKKFKVEIINGKPTVVEK
jgi:hypothetical protein